MRIIKTAAFGDTPLWKRRTRLPADRKVEAVSNAICQLLGSAVQSVVKDSKWRYVLILNADPPEVDQKMVGGGWKMWHKQEHPTQTDLKYSNPNFTGIGVDVVHWFGKNGHEIDIESLEGLE